MINDLAVGNDTVAVIDWERGGRTVLFTISGAHLDTWMNSRFGSTAVRPIGPSSLGWLGTASRSQGLPPLEAGERWVDSVDVFLLDPERRALGDLVMTVPRLMLYGINGPAGERQSTD
jgi:hypothetical protein